MLITQKTPLLITSVTFLTYCDIIQINWVKTFLIPGFKFLFCKLHVNNKRSFAVVAGACFINKFMRCSGCNSLICGRHLLKSNSRPRRQPHVPHISGGVFAAPPQCHGGGSFFFFFHSQGALLSLRSRGALWCHG